MSDKCARLRQLFPVHSYVWCSLFFLENTQHKTMSLYSSPSLTFLGSLVAREIVPFAVFLSDNRF